MVSQVSEPDFELELSNADKRYLSALSREHGMAFGEVLSIAIACGCDCLRQGLATVLAERRG